MMRCPDCLTNLDEVPIDQPCPTCGSGRRDAIVQPPTIDVRVSIPAPTILMRQHAWYTWAEISIDHEAESRRARDRKSPEEFRPGLVAITSAAFALDALYGVAKDLGIPAPEGPRAARGKRVAELLRRGVGGGPKQQSWPTRIGALFDSRDKAVHFGEETAPPVFHTALDSHVAVEVFAWRLEAAVEAVDLLLEVFGEWAARPSTFTKSWARDNGRAIAELTKRRAIASGEDG